MKRVQEAGSEQKRKQVRSREEKEALCAQWRQSGLTQAEFCRLKGISDSTFKGWLEPKKPWIRLLWGQREQEKAEQVQFRICLEQPSIVEGSLPLGQFKDLIQSLSHAD